MHKSIKLKIEQIKNKYILIKIGAKYIKHKTAMKLIIKVLKQKSTDKLKTQKVIKQSATNNIQL